MGATRVPGATFLLIAILVLATLLRLLPIHEYHAWDESAYLLYAEKIAFGRDNYDESFYRPPVLPVLLSGAFLVWHSPYAASILGAVLGALGALAAYLLGQQAHDDLAGLFGALLYAAHPLFIENSRFILTDAIVVTFALFALYLARRQHWGAWLSAGVLTGTAVITKFSAAIVVPAIGLALVLKHRSMRSAFVFCVGGALPLLPFFLWSWQRFGHPLGVVKNAFVITNLHNGGALYYATLRIFTVPLLLGLVCYFLFLFSQHRRDVTAFSLTALVWAALLLGFLTIFPTKDERYALLAIAPLLVLAGMGYRALAARFARHRTAVVWGVTLLVLVAAYPAADWLQGPAVNHWKSSEVDMSQRINALGDTGVLYVTSHYPVYGYYTTRRVVVVDGPYFTQGYPRNMPLDGLLVVSRNALRDPTPGWADSQRELQRVDENDEVLLYRYTRQ